MHASSRRIPHTGRIRKLRVPLRGFASCTLPSMRTASVLHCTALVLHSCCTLLLDRPIAKQQPVSMPVSYISKFPKSK